MVDLNLSVCNLDDKILFSKSLDYNHNIFLDNNIYIHYNNKKVYKKLGK